MLPYKREKKTIECATNAVEFNLRRQTREPFI